MQVKLNKAMTIKPICLYSTLISRKFYVEQPRETELQYSNFVKENLII